MEQNNIKKYKVALIKWTDIDCHFNQDDYHDFKEKIVERITEWEEVDQETYNILSRYQVQGKFILITWVENQKEKILQTVAEYAEDCRKRDEAAAKAKEDRDRKKAEKDMLKNMRDEEKRKLIYEKLKNEFEPTK